MTTPMISSDMREALADVLADFVAIAPEQQEWLPIESAPRGQPILVYCPEGVEVPEENYCWPIGTFLHVLQAHWHDPDLRTSEPSGWYAPFTQFYGGVGSDPSCEFNSILLAPTHWVPLLPPPPVR